MLFARCQDTRSHMVDRRPTRFPAQRVGSLQVWPLPALLDGFTVQLPLALKLPIMLGKPKRPPPRRAEAACQADVPPRT